MKLSPHMIYFAFVFVVSFLAALLIPDLSLALIASGAFIAAYGLWAPRAFLPAASRFLIIMGGILVALIGVVVAFEPLFTMGL